MISVISQALRLTNREGEVLQANPCKMQESFLTICFQSKSITYLFVVAVV